jgi:hypothetical protein
MIDALDHVPASRRRIQGHSARQKHRTALAKVEVSQVLSANSIENLPLIFTLAAALRHYRFTYRAHKTAHPKARRSCKSIALLLDGDAEFL